MNCDLYADIVMNGVLNGANNRLESQQSDLWCGACSPPTCLCDPTTSSFKPLLWLYKSLPQLNDGRNAFVFQGDGTFIYDKSNRCPTYRVVNLRQNYYEASGRLANPPALGNNHFCPTTGFADGSPLQQPPLCVEFVAEGLTDLELLYQLAITNEQSGNLAQAQGLYDSIVTQYGETAEARWSARGYLRAGLADEVPFMQQHGSLYAMWLDETLPLELRQAGRREAIWALIAGEEYGSAQYELEPITQVESDPDSLWALVTLELVMLLEQGGPGIQSVGDRQPMQAQLADFHDHLHQIMGRATDEEVLAQSALPKSKDLAVAYPNPFNSTVTIRYEMPTAGKVQLEIFNLLGQKVATLVNDFRDMGTYSQQWNATDVPSGVYFYRFRTGSHFETHKLLLLK